jgi:RND family efflux transporter MFP subunit
MNEITATAGNADVKTSAPRAVRHVDLGNWLAAGAAAVVAIILIYFFVTGQQVVQAQAETPHPALTVTTVTPGHVTWAKLVTASGLIAPWEEASIGTQIGSYQLTEVRVNVGDKVRQGQLLAKLNPALLRAEEAQLVAREQQARTNGVRASALRASGGISDQEALQFTTEARTAAAALDAKRLELRYTSVIAPDDGVITARLATLGAVVPAGQELFRMIRKHRLEWRGEVTAAQLGAIAEGQPISLSLPDGTSAKAIVRQTAPALDPQSRLAIVYADLASGSRARAGMYVQGGISVGDAPALAVPAECVVVRDGRSYVMIAPGAGASSKVRLRAVTTGRRNADMIEILSGISAHDRLVRRGAAFLNDGDVVAVANPGKGKP